MPSLSIYICVNISRNNQYIMPPLINFPKVLLAVLYMSVGILLNAQECTPEECLWPGDANRNGICNNMDILWIGLAHQDNIGGPERENAVFSWTPQSPPSNWDGFFPVSGINYKYADVDGSGWIDGGDSGIFPELYGQVNDQFTSFLGSEILGDDLFFIPSNPNPAPGETVEISIHLGTADNPITDIYGIAFTIDFDTSIVQENETIFTNEGGWMNTTEDNLYTFNKQFAPAGIIKPEFAYVSQDGQSMSGFGEICKMDIVIEDILIGLDGEPVDSIALDLKFKRVLGLNAEEEDMLITIAQTTMVVTATEEVLLPITDIKVLSQTKNQRIFIQSDSKINQALLINTSGQTIYRRSPHGTELEIFTTGFPAGIYFLYVRTQEGERISKLAVIDSR